MTVKGASRRKDAWSLVLGLLLGLALGLFYAWKVSPVQYVDTDPSSLRADFKDQYRAMIALAYLSTGDLARAQSRLALLREADPLHTLADQAQRWMVQGDSGEAPYALLLLVKALRGIPPGQTVAITTTAPPPEVIPSPVTTLPAMASPSATARPTVTPLSIVSPTPRPTRTATPTLGAPFTLSRRQVICDPNLPEGLLQIEIKDSTGKPVAGIEIVIIWQGGEEHFFTGLKPDLGDGYADYVMAPQVSYALRVLPNSTPLTGLSMPLCRRENGNEYGGSLYLMFEQK